MSFSIEIDPRAIEDVQESIDFYEDQEKGLGKEFEIILHKHFQQLKKNPFFQKRYDNVHCLPINKFSHMVHNTIDEKSKTIIRFYSPEVSGLWVIFLKLKKSALPMLEKTENLKIWEFVFTTRAPRL